MTRPLTIAFDLDGTLVDTAPDLIRATNHVLQREGLEAASAEEIRPFVSFGARAMIERGLAVNRVRRKTATVDAMLARFLAFYEENIAVDSRPYPMLPEVLDRLAAAGTRLAVCTNKSESLSLLLLGRLDLARHFSVVCGRERFGVSKPHPDHLIKTIEAAGGSAGFSVMIGDSGIDVATARAAGVPVIGVSFGYTEVPMRDLAPDALIDHFSELWPALERIGRAP